MWCGEFGDKRNLLGQLCVLQEVVELELPEQELPPYCGVGFVQVLVLVFVPPAHDLVQLP